MIRDYLLAGAFIVTCLGAMFGFSAYQDRGRAEFEKNEKHRQWLAEKRAEQELTTELTELVNLPTELVEVAPQQLIHSDVLGMDITKTEYEEFARVVMNEAGGESYSCMVAVAQTIINRVKDSNYPNTITEVINQPYQYSHNWNGQINWQVYQACEKVLNEQIYSPKMLYFRDWYYHDFGIPYIQIDEMYFSLGE